MELVQDSEKRLKHNIIFDIDVKDREMADGEERGVN